MTLNERKLKVSKVSEMDKKQKQLESVIDAANTLIDFVIGRNNSRTDILDGSGERLSPALTRQQVAAKIYAIAQRLPFLPETLNESNANTSYGRKI